MLRAATCLILLCLSATSALAQSTMYDGDPQRKIKEDVEEIFGLYILNPSRRHGGEKVELKKGRGGAVGVELALFFDQREKFSKDDVKCLAYRWLLFGRFGEGGGARELFSRYPKVTHADLVFYTLVTDRKDNGHGKYEVTQERKDFLITRLSRGQAKKLNWDVLEKQLSVDGSKCARAGEKVVDRKWYGKYLGKRQ